MVEQLIRNQQVSGSTPLGGFVAQAETASRKRRPFQLKQTSNTTRLGLGFLLPALIPNADFLGTFLRSSVEFLPAQAGIADNDCHAGCPKLPLAHVYMDIVPLSIFVDLVVAEKALKLVT